MAEQFVYVVERTDAIGADEAVAFVVVARNRIAAVGHTAGWWHTTWDAPWIWPRGFGERVVPMTEWPVTVRSLGVANALSPPAEGIVLRDFAGC